MVDTGVTVACSFYGGGSSKKTGAKPHYAGLNLTLNGYTLGATDSPLPLSAPRVLMGGNVRIPARVDHVRHDHDEADPILSGLWRARLARPLRPQGLRPAGPRP